MPQLYNKAVITNAGIALLNKAQAGDAAIQFTRMAVGNGTYAAEEKTPAALRERTGLKSEKNSYAISSIDATSADGVKLTALLTNQDPATGAALVTDGYYLNEIGLYAKEKDGGDDTEALYSVAVAAIENRDYMPAFAPGDGPAQIIQEYCARVSDAASVTIVHAGAVMLEGSFDINAQTPTFEEAGERENIVSGELLGVILGKIKKFFTDLHLVAFTGSYDDLKDKPELFSGDYNDLSNAPTITFPTSLPADGGNADTVGDKDLAYIMNYENLSNKPMGSVVSSATISAANWTGDAAPFENGLSVEGATESSVVDISLSSSATQEQATAWMAGQFADGGQEAGSVTVKAFGSKPEVDIPVTVVVRGDA